MSLISKLGYFLIKDEVERLKNEIQKLKSDLFSKTQTIENENTLRRDAEKKSNTLEEQVLNLTQSLNAEQERTNSLESQVSSLENGLSNANKKKEQNWQLVLQERKSKDDEIKRLNEAHAQECEILRSKNDAERSSLQNELASVSSRYNSQSETLSKLIHQNELITLNNEELNSQISSVNQELESLKKERNTYLIDLENTTRFLSQLQQEKEDIETRLYARPDFTQVLREKEQIITSLQNDVSSKQSEIRVFENNIQTLNERISELNGEKENLKIERNSLERKVDELESSLRAMADASAHVRQTEQALLEAQSYIEELKEQLRRAPRAEDFAMQAAKIRRLEEEKVELQQKVNELTESLDELGNRALPKEPTSPHEPIPKNEHGPISQRQPRPITSQTHRTKTVRWPYVSRAIAPSRNVLTKDFPPIENDNIYAHTERTITEVLNVRTNPTSVVTAKSVFLDKSVEEIARLSRDLVEAHNRNEPYLICPCCRQNLKISSRTVGGFGNTREIQFFTHAVKNYPCELKRDPIFTSIEGNPSFDIDERNNFEDFREQFFTALTSDVSLNKGVSNVEKATYVVSDVLPIMKRRFAHIQAIFNQYDIVFEFVSKNTNISKVYDRDIFYLINRKQVFWVFGLDAIVDYKELKRHVAKDILFTNKRNVFVFDLEAQEATRFRGELVLKCNWLDENDEWAFQIERNGKNGILITLDEILFNEEESRPYRFDADVIYFDRHPDAVRPAKPNREQLIAEIIAEYNFEQERNAAISEMLQSGEGVTAYKENDKWGFKYKDTIFIKPTFIEEPLFKNGYAIVKRDSKYGVITRYAVEVLSPVYNYVDVLPNGEIIYSDGKNWYIFGILDSISLYNSNSDLILNSVSDDLDIYYLSINPHLYVNQQPNEYYFIKRQIFRKDETGKWQLWYSNGSRVNEDSWDKFQITDQSTIIVTKNNRKTEYDLEGNIIFEQKYKSETPLSNGNLLVESFHSLWSIVDADGNRLSPEEYILIEELSDDYLRFQKNTKWGVLSLTGDIIVPPEYNSITSVENNFFNATIIHPNGWKVLDGRISLSGDRIVNLIGRNSNGSEIISSFNLYGVRYNGRLVLPFEYDELRFAGDNRFIAKKGDKVGLLNLQGHHLLEFEYDSILLLNSGNYEAVKGNNIQLFNKNIQPVNDEVITLQNGFKKIKQNGKWGIISPDGKNDVECRYDEISTFRGRLIGIINGQLVKLNAYYPFRLMMVGKNVADQKKDLVEIAGFKFQINPKRLNRTINEKVEVALVNVTKTMQYPTVVLFTKEKATKLAKHIDKPEDFIIGEEVTAIITEIIFNKGKRKTVLKNIDVLTTDNRVSHVFKANLDTSNINISTLSKGTKLLLTKINYSEELDRTNWSIKKV